MRPASISARITGHGRSSTPGVFAAAGLLVAVVGVASLAPTASASASEPIDSVTTEEVAQSPSDSRTTVAEPCNVENLRGSACGSPVTMRYGRAAADGSGTGAALRLLAFEAGGEEYRSLPAVTGSAYTEVFRVDNADVSGARDSIFLVGTDNATPLTVVMSDPAGATMADIFSDDLITQGSDNTFANSRTTAVTFDNVERISFLRDQPVVTPSPALVGLSLVERGGNDDVTAAAVLAVDESGMPSAWGPTVRIPAEGGWGPIFDAPSTVLRRDETDEAYRPIDATPTQTVSGMYISFAELGVQPGTPVHGVSLVGNDETTVGEQGANLLTDGTEQGGIDLIGGIVSAAVSLGAPDATTGPQGQPQSVDPLANDVPSFGATIDPTSVELTPPGGTAVQPGDPVVIPGVGSFVADVTTGAITFVPEPDFTGTPEPLGYQATDSLGAVLTSTYTPTVTPAGVSAGGGTPPDPTAPAGGVSPAGGAAAGGSGDGELAATGSEAGAPSAAAIAVLLLGIAALLASRRRTRRRSGSSGAEVRASA